MKLNFTKCSRRFVDGVSTQPQQHECSQEMYNVFINSYEPILIGDKEVRVVNGIRFGAINGIGALRRREKKGVPRKRSEEFIEIAKKLKDRTDVLLLHNSPYIYVEGYRGQNKTRRKNTSSRHSHL